MLTALMGVLAGTHGTHQACRVELNGKGKLQIWDLGGLMQPV